MNWLAKINLTNVVKKLGTFKSAVLLVFLIGLSVFCGYRFGNYYHGFQVQTLAQQKSRLESLYDQQVENVRRVHILEVELEVERLANQRSMNTLKSMEAEHYQVKKALGFYEKVMAPEKQIDGLVIDSFTIYDTESPNHYRFQATLLQQQLKKKYAKGYLNVVFIGSLDNKPNHVKLTTVSTLTKKELSFSFQYFQIIEGEFTLPEKFIPEQIELTAVLSKSRNQKVKRLTSNYPWPIDLKSNSISATQQITNVDTN